MRDLITFLASAGAALVLTACGGGSSYDPGPVVQPQDDTKVPAAAVATSTSMVTYLSALPRSEVKEALGVTGLALTKSETDEPLVVGK